MNVAKSKYKISTKDKSYCINDAALFKIGSKKRLALVLQLDTCQTQALKALCANYNVFKNKNSAGKERIIQNPFGELDRLHSRIASLLCRIATPDYLHSGVKKRSNYTNARVHLGRNQVLTVDIKSFFPSTSWEKVFNFYYKQMQCSPDIARILANLCTYNRHVPTGSRISMPMAFWANYPMFNELENLAKQHDVKMTVYVDDLTFSGNKITDLFMKLVSNIVYRHNHRLNERKTRIYHRDRPKVITGIIVKNNETLVRNEKHMSIYQSMNLWLPVKDFSDNSSRQLKNRLIGKLYAHGVINPRFKDKARTIRNYKCA